MMDNVKNNKWKKAVKGGKPKIYPIFQNWVHQSFFYLDSTEKIFRILLELIPSGIIFIILDLIIKMPIISALTAIFLVHTLNWIFNNNFWACLLFSFPSWTNKGDKNTLEYLSIFQKRCINVKYISGVLIFGSVSRKMWHDRSDLDIRVLRKQGFTNAIKAYLFLVYERYLAVKNGQPFDIYLADDIGFLCKLRKDEFPVFLKNDDIRLHEHYHVTDCEVLTNKQKMNDL